MSGDKKGSEQSKVKKEQSYVFIGKGKKGSSTASLLDNFKTDSGESPFKKASKQVKKEVYGVGGLVSYPYAPANFLILCEANPVFAACVKQIAKDVAGLGYKLVLKDKEKENEVERAKIQAFLDRPNPIDSLRTILNELLIDWGVIGWYGIEVVKNVKGEVEEIYHVPAHTFKIHKDKKKFYQERGMKKVWFKGFGVEENYSAKTGIEGDYDLKTRANELIYYRNYYPRSDFYGAPNILSALGSVMALIEIRDFNLSFFENYGIPAWLIALKGDWADDSVKTITNFLDSEVKGSKNAHRTMAFKINAEDSLDAKKLSENTQEASFKTYIQILVDDILISYSMPGYRIGLSIIGRLGGTNIREANEIYKNGVVEPLQEDIEDIINHKIIEEGLDCKSYKFKLNDIDIRDIDAEVKRYVSLINVGAMSPNQVRNLLDLGEHYPEGDKFYISSNLVEVGEEPIEKRQDKFMEVVEDLKKDVRKLISDDKK